MTYIGVDPGLNGGIAVMRSNGTITVRPYDANVYLDIIHNTRVGAMGSVVACVESVHAMPRQGVSSTFTFGRNFGFILGMFFAEHISVVLVDPRKWKKHFGIGRDKSESINLVKTYYPNVILLATPRCKTDHDGMAEALLIARYLKDTYPIDTNQIPTEKRR